jgi:hypothetical protein
VNVKIIYGPYFEENKKLAQQYLLECIKKDIPEGTSFEAFINNLLLEKKK